MSMKNYNVLFALTIFSLMVGIFILTKVSPEKTNIIIFSLPESKGCVYPTKEVRYTRTEIKHSIPVSQVHKCRYDKRNRLIKVSTFNFERGYQMKKPTKVILYQWVNLRLSQYSIRKATHGNGEIDVEVYRLHN